MSEGWTKKCEDGVATLADVCVHILLLLILTGNDQAEMLIVVDNFNSFAVEGPRTGFLVVLYVNFRASYYYFGFIGIEV